MVSILLLYFNFPPCVPLYHGLHSTSLFKLTPSLRSTKQWYPFYFLIETSPPTFHQTMVSIPLLSLNFPPCVPLNHCLHSTLYLNFPPCVPLNHCFHSTALVKLPPPAFHYTIVSILFLYFNSPPARPTQPWSPHYFFI